jgi:hypothetical protein
VEEVLVLILQGLFEVGLEVFFYAGLAWPWPNDKQDSAGFWAGGGVLFFVVGGVLGLLFTLIFPKLLLPYGWLRMANLVLAPAASGLFAWYVARWRRTRTPGVVPQQHAVFAVLFTLAFAAVRFAYGQH